MEGEEEIFTGRLCLHLVDLRTSVCWLRSISARLFESLLPNVHSTKGGIWLLGMVDLFFSGGILEGAGRGVPLFPKILHASSLICGCSSCPVTGTVTPEHSAAAKHLAPSPTVQMKNKHNLPF
ncbi:hypothetical protein EYF80_016911 [Liparis tanakae]|uniref:Uncharacterized protein n=1 Tax=Liparis tanakae TaxID=230148 RepID=A0A4Z2I4P8_9TELE|nr:hypothetical protein EYF80_016911 [Liparis tanakae]